MMCLPTKTNVWLLTACFAVLLTVHQSHSFAQKRKPNSRLPSPAQLSTQEIARRALPAVVLLVCDDGERASKGSGFFIRPGLLVTNYHVIEGMARGIARVAVGRRKEKRNFRVTRVIAYDKEADLALLSVPDAREASVPTLPLVPDGKSAQVGDSIYALGNPVGLIGTISPGIVSAGMRGSQRQARLQITAPISHGSSGGPVVNSRGEVVGIAVGSLSDGQNLNFAVPSSLVWSILETAKFPNQLEELLDTTSYADSASLKGSWTWPETTATTSRTAPPVSIIGPLRQGESKERASLRKLAGVHFVIGTLAADTKRILSEQQIQTEVELRLRRNRVPLLTEAESLRTPGTPVLYLRLDVLQSKSTELYSYSYTLELNQAVFLERDPQFRMLSRTWQMNVTGFAGSGVAESMIRESIGETVDGFCNEYLAAN